jgi:DNA-directed RNA polymerase subunit M/transcription elongation factor TFIIS
MIEDCPECGDRLYENVERRIDDGDQIEECQTCGHETMRVEDITQTSTPALL